MNIIFSTLIAILIILSFALLAAVFAAWLDRKDNEEFIEKTADKVSSLIDSKMASVTGQRETGPWYLAVYTKNVLHPIWISNNNIRSIHPDQQSRKLIIKQFNGEDMVIENVEKYVFCATNEMYAHEMF